MREKRRLKIAQRQLALAQIARRAARLSLANALAEEDRSAAVCERSEKLLAAYESRIAKPDLGSNSDNLQSNLAFVRALQTMSDNARDALKDARDQAEFHMRTMAATETKMNAHENRVHEEKRALQMRLNQREVPPELTGMSGVARKLHDAHEAGEEVVRKDTL